MTEHPDRESVEERRRQAQQATQREAGKQPSDSDQKNPWATPDDPNQSSADKANQTQGIGRPSGKNEMRASSRLQRSWVVLPAAVAIVVLVVSGLKALL